MLRIAFKSGGANSSSGCDASSSYITVEGLLGDEPGSALPDDDVGMLVVIGGGGG